MVDAKSVSARKNLDIHIANFLSAIKTLRKCLQISLILLPVLTAVAKIAESDAGEALKASAVTAQIIFIITGALVALLLLITETSSLTIFKDAKKSAEDLAEFEQKLIEIEQENEALTKEIEKTSISTMTIDIMRQAIDSHLLDVDSKELKEEYIALLDLLSASKESLFGMKDEQWNFSIYLWDTSSQQLKCVACRRPTKADEDKPHRSWLSGEGHVGKTFASKRAIVISDTLDPNVRGLFDAPIDKQPPNGEDAKKYRSIASFPIQLSGSHPSSLPLGVVVATSDQPGRFVPKEDGTEDEAVRPIRHLSNTLATLLSLNNLREKD
ncbi:hypothetical protein [uncultured Brevundimonas sp.]|uniref:hypothetical protein n=1 Tax=uncultured Brevundimonas sp. TaxID=213418 RepID=UPI00260BE783|nr:hypothetical protein [uncultured Brevundimonas sp.]